MSQETASSVGSHKSYIASPAAPTLFAVREDALGDGNNSSSNSSNGGYSDDEMDAEVSDNDSFVEKWYGGYDRKQHIRQKSSGSHANADDEENAEPLRKQIHHWHTRPPLLPERMATLVSSVSGATRLSLEIVSLFWEAVFDTIAESTSSGLLLGSTAWQEAKAVALTAASILSPLSALNPQIVSRIISSSTAAGYSVVNQSLTAAENILEGGFSLYTKAVNMSLHAAGEYVRLIDAIFGSTDTSRVLAYVVHMCRREALDNNPEIRALIGEVGLVSFVSQVVKTIVAWICLQVVNHGRSRPYRLDLVYTNIRNGAEFCPRKFIDSNGKPLTRKSSFTRTPEGKSAASTPLGVSPRMAASALPSVASVPAVAAAAAAQCTASQYNVHVCNAQPLHATASGANRSAASGGLACMCNQINQMHAQITSPKSAASETIEAHQYSVPLEASTSTHGANTKFDFGDSGSDEDEDEEDMYYALSDQEVSHRDPEWDQRLVEALRGLSVQLERQKQQQQKQQQQDEKMSRGNQQNNLGVSSPKDSLAQQRRSSLWGTISAVREAAAKKQHSESSSTSSGCASPSSPLLPSSIQRSMGLPTFESAPASLVSSPQFSTTPFNAAANVTRKINTMAEEPVPFLPNTDYSVSSSSNGKAFVPNGTEIKDDESYFRLDGLPPTIPPIVDTALPPKESKWLQQEFPRKPLLFNLARFISLASSVYGHSFMRVLGLDHGMIDARALIDEFGDYEVHDHDSSASHLSAAGSSTSINIEANAKSLHHLSSTSQMSPGTTHERTPSMSKLPRAQPMSSYHTHSAYNPSRPDSQRQYERRHFRSSRSETPGSRHTLGRRPPVRRNHHRRRPVTDHPNHFCFSQHTGIPLSDLLFSSYVSPIVPGVTKSANAKATAMERKLRRKSSYATLKSKRSQNGLRKAKLDGNNVTTPSLSRSGSKQNIDATAKDTKTQSAGWVSSIPVVSTIYQSLPSPVSMWSSVPIVPGVVSSFFGSKSAADTADSSNPQNLNPQRKPEPAKKHTNQSTDETNKQFRRFEKIRQRLVYRNPSIHALVHYIAVDHATRSVVLACRGTLGISDLFIDMICEYETIHLLGHSEATANSEFRVHSGMWHSALLLADSSSEVFKEVAEALRLYPEYGLVLTGHSLGGGVASLLTLLWSRPLFGYADGQVHGAALPGVKGQSPTPGSTRGSTRQFVTMDKFGLVTPRPIHCFSFGSPCSTNAALSYYCRGLVTSVANSDDFITYLSIGACVDILNISAVLGREHGVAEKVMRKFFSSQKNKLKNKLNVFDFDFSKLRAYSHDDSDEEVGAVDNGDKDDVIDTGKNSTNKKPTGYWWSRKSVQKDHVQGGSRRKTSTNIRPNGSESASSTASSRPAKRQKNSSSSNGDKQKSKNAGDLDDWYLSLIKTLRANMDSEKLYPPGDVFILATLGDDDVADEALLLRVDELSEMQPVGSSCADEKGQKPPFATPSSAPSFFSKNSSNTGSQNAGSESNYSFFKCTKSLPPSNGDKNLPVGLFYCPDVVERFSELRFTRNMIAHHLPSTYERRLSALVHETIFSARESKAPQAKQ
ncbi:hypothetical protein GGI25_005110 [Coemansia spiralis]|uniref:sn-1-specific diacylglycerol lipase n=2 Tax=Coemansia TaxID=4863 RepID=A0A9W8G3J2_9FUNG|nr:hypothetical protein EDC05_005017 [Coemansia umbellata]KAJ2620023.1 hypothetical protein GGI26_005372 [Coemansia sp. RSA 1358]KAJ2672507.1 hypothetical protein GGI25_005110 [Coemansia spiralis]